MTITEQEIMLAKYCAKHSKGFCEMDLEIINDEYNVIWAKEYEKETKDATINKLTDKYQYDIANRIYKLKTKDDFSYMTKLKAIELSDLVICAYWDWCINGRKI